MFTNRTRKKNAKEHVKTYNLNGIRKLSDLTIKLFNLGHLIESKLKLGYV